MEHHSDAKFHLGACRDLYVNACYATNIICFVCPKKNCGMFCICCDALDGEACQQCRAMFDGHYKEKEASIIPVPNISFQVFEKMMRAIYTSK